MGELADAFSGNSELLQKIIDGLTQPDKPSDIKYEWDIMKEDKEPKSDKYYTPTIEEFHVGFEYEELWYGGGKSPSGEDWVSHVYNGESLTEEYSEGQSSIEEEIRDKEIRVKYLDKEDIESLGFVYKGTSDHNRLGLKGEMVPISGFSKNLGDGEFCHITCFLEDDNRVHNGSLRIECTDCFEDIDSSPFAGYREGGSGPFVDQMRIKNKSELKVLLKQLGINLEKDEN
jgi:hypothetical protein